MSIGKTLPEKGCTWWTAELTALRRKRRAGWLAVTTEIAQIPIARQVILPRETTRELCGRPRGTAGALYLRRQGKKLKCNTVRAANVADTVTPREPLNTLLPAHFPDPEEAACPALNEGVATDGG